MASNRGDPPCPPVLDREARRRAFRRAAREYASAAVLAREVGVRQIERLTLIRAQPKRILDLGCGPGTHTAALSERYPEAQVVALDLTQQMLRQLEGASPSPERAGKLDATFGRTLGRTLERVNRWLNATTQPEPRRIVPIQADFEQLPFAAESFDFVWSNLALAHTLDLPRALREIAKVTRAGGLVMLALPGPDTLSELRRALAKLELPDTTHPFPDMHDVGDMLIDAGFADPVVDSERLTLEYTTPERLWGDARALGAVTARRDRPRGLTTPRRLQRIEAALRNPHATTASAGGSFSNAPMRLTVEVVYAHAWKVAPKTIEDGRAIVRLHRQRPDAPRRTNGAYPATAADS